MSFALLKEGSTQAWKNAKSGSERKHRSETGDSQLCITLFQTIPEKGSQGEKSQLKPRQDFKTSLHSMQISRKTWICFTLLYFLLKLVEANWTWSLVHTIWPSSQHYLLLSKARSGYGIIVKSSFLSTSQIPVQGRSLEKKTPVRSRILVRGKRITHATKPAFMRANFLLQRKSQLCKRKHTYQISAVCKGNEKWWMFITESAFNELNYCILVLVLRKRSSITDYETY